MALPPPSAPTTLPAKPSSPHLRRDAEAAAGPPAVTAPLDAEAALKALHELRVHQIELEMQNDELRRTQAELEMVRARYFDLYDLAPVGYCTLDEAGLII